MLLAEAGMAGSSMTAADCDGSGSYGARPTVPTVATSLNPAGSAKQVIQFGSQTRWPASELYRPEAPNDPVRSTGLRMSYCEATAFRHPIPRMEATRPNVKLRWVPRNPRPQGGGTHNPLGIKALQLWGNPQPLPGYKNSFTSRCFRCLSKDHKLSSCRDPLRCLTCRRSGHLARDCPDKHS